MTAHLVSDFPNIKQAQLFNSLTSEFVDQLLLTGKNVYLPTGAFLFHQQDPASHCYLLLDGQIKLESTNRGGDQVSVQQVAPGGMIALLGVFQKTKYPVSALAILDCVVLSWTVDDFQNFCVEVPQLHINSTQILTMRSQEFQSRILELSTEKVERRVAHALLRLAQHLGKRIQSGVLIDLRLTRQDIAELSGTTQFTASRTLSRLQNAGIIAGTKHQIIIQDIHQLVDLAEDFPNKYRSLLD